MLDVRSCSRWIQNEIMTQSDRERSYFFNSFFYKKLTLRAPKEKNDNQTSAAERRFNRVRRWTKKINLFEKDFIVVPICEQ